MATINTENFITTAEAAVMLDLAVNSVKIYCQKGLIRGVKVGHIWMIPKSEVDRYMEERRDPGRPQAE